MIVQFMFMGGAREHGGRRNCRGDRGGPVPPTNELGTAKQCRTFQYVFTLYSLLLHECTMTIEINTPTP